MLQFYNTLTSSKVPFKPLDAQHIKMYVCGPTVYARPHIGNARSVVVYDVLYRLLQQCFPQVTYVRNITDVDDKINAAAIENGETIQALTARVTQQFHDDMDALGCLRPTIEPRATEHIPQIITMIESLIAHGNAYVGNDGKHVLFDVTSTSDNAQWRYGMLSGRTVEEQEAGARVAVESYKRHPGDFVLWKPADAQDDASSKFDSPWGVGRPGWHIECSAMSTAYLGETFDIHGGGADLKFPHHENEIAQSCCANPKSQFARHWIHNGFLTVNGEKMSKSLGNFVTVRDLLDKGIKGEVIRLALLSAKYNEPLDWNDKAIADAKKLLDWFYRKLRDANLPAETDLKIKPDSSVMDALCEDMNTPLALSNLQRLSDVPETLRATAALLGLLQQDPEEWFKGKKVTNTLTVSVDAILVKELSDEDIDKKKEERIAAKKAKDFATADRIRGELKAQGIILEDRPDGTTDWRRE